MSIQWDWKSSRHTLDSAGGIIIVPPDPPIPDPETLTLELAVPDDTNAGDLLIALISTDANPAITEPSGWVLQDQIGGTAKSSAHSRLADGTEEATYTWTLDGAEDAVGAIILLRRVHPTQYIDAKIIDSGTGSTVSIPSITTSVNKAMLITLISLNDGVLIDETISHRGKVTTLWVVDTSGQQIGSVGSFAGYTVVNKAGATTPFDLFTVGLESTDYYSLQIAVAPLRSNPAPGPADDAILQESDDYVLLDYLP